MPYLDVYISNMDDSEPDENGLATKTPKRKSPFFRDGRNAWTLFHQWRESGKIHAVQTDWAGWVAFLTKREIKEFFELLYSDDLNDEVFAHLEEEKQKLQRHIEQLNPDRKHALCATEL